MPQLTLNGNGSEKIAYTHPRYPLRITSGDLHSFDSHAALAHWHDDFEFLLADQSGMMYFVNGTDIPVPCGSAIFVNSQRIHFGYAADSVDCRFRVIVFPASLFSGCAAAAEAVAHLASDFSRDSVLITPDRDADLLRDLNTLYDIAPQADPLQTLMLCARILSALTSAQGTVPAHGNPTELTIIHRMTGFITRHYTEKITIADIAAAGAVCRSRCCRMFKEKLRATPTGYLTEYRLAKACDMLRSGCSVTDTALSCGFESGSYFTRVFQKHRGTTPLAWQKQMMHTAGS